MKRMKERREKGKTSKYRIRFSEILLILMAAACLILGAVSLFKGNGEEPRGSSMEPKIFNARLHRPVMTQTALKSRENNSLIAVAAKSSQEEAAAAKEAALREKVSELAMKAVGELEDGDVYERSRDAEDRQIKANQYEIMGISSVTAAQMTAHYKAHATYPSAQMSAGGAPDITDFVQIIFDEATAEGVRPEVVYSQAMNETGWLRFGGDDSISQYNFAGLGTVGDGNPGNSFPDVRTGIRAQVQHLKAYASTDALNEPCVDTRFDMIPRGCAPYVQWLGIKENPYGIGWAGAEHYGDYLMKIIVEVRSM